jgi:hypothetical protein
MQFQLLSSRLAILPSGCGRFPLGYNDTRLELIGVVVGILAFLLSLMGSIHTVGKKSFHSFAFQKPSHRHCTNHIAILPCRLKLNPRSKIGLSLSYSDYCPIQNLMDFELAEMPSCNLATTVHNKWLQQSSNRRNDLYVATMDDFVRALIQVLRYYQYLKGELIGTGPGKEELMLRVAQRLAQRFGNPKVLNATIAKVPGAAKFCTWKPYFEDKEVCGCQNCKRMYP